MKQDIFIFLKKQKQLNIFIILQLTLSIIILANLVTILNFENTYISSYNKYLPTEDSVILSFDDFLLSGDFNSLEEKRYDITRYLNKNNIEYIDVRQNIYSIEDFSINKAPSHFKTTGNGQLRVSKINFYFIEELSEYIDENINEDYWSVEGKIIPVLLGYNYKKMYKKGDVIRSYNYVLDDNEEIISLRVIGFFDKGVMYISGSDTISYSECTDSGLFVPLLREDKYSGGSPLIIKIKSNSNFQNIVNDINIISDNKIILKDFNNDLYNVIPKIKNEKSVAIFNFVITSILCIASLIFTISYKIIKCKDVIGIIYSVGGSKRFVERKFIGEFLILMLIAIIISIPIYRVTGKNSFLFFINTNLYMNVFFAIIISIIIFIVSLKLGLKFLNKYTPHELVGGFRE